MLLWSNRESFLKQLTQYCTAHTGVVLDWRLLCWTRVCCTKLASAVLEYYIVLDLGVLY